MIISVRGRSFFSQCLFISNNSSDGKFECTCVQKGEAGGVNGEQRWHSVYNVNQGHSPLSLNYPPC